MLENFAPIRTSTGRRSRITKTQVNAVPATHVSSTSGIGPRGETRDEVAVPACRGADVGLDCAGVVAHLAATPRLPRPPNPRCAFGWQPRCPIRLFGGARGDRDRTYAREVSPTLEPIDSSQARKADQGEFHRIRRYAPWAPGHCYGHFRGCEGAKVPGHDRSLSGRSKSGVLCHEVPVPRLADGLRLAKWTAYRFGGWLSALHRGAASRPSRARGAWSLWDCTASADGPTGIVG